MGKMDELNVNLGLPARLTDPFLRQRALGRQMLAVLSASALPLEVVLFRLLDALPCRFRHAVIVAAWWLWLALHRALPARVARRGLAWDMSLEAHALGNVFWWARLVPMTLRRLRFALGQMDGTCPPSRQLSMEPVNVQERGLRGLYLHLSKEEQPCVLFWIFGGAFAGGGVQPTAGMAERYGKALGCDVFLVDMRLCPENTIQDAFADACRGYEWLLSRTPPERIVVYGLSSGGGVAARVLQLARGREESCASIFASPAPLPQPAGAVLCGPFLRYTSARGSMLSNASVDLVVNQSVLELIEPLMGTFCGGVELRERCSPLSHDCAGLCPLLVSASVHEVCIDEDLEFARKAKAAGVRVDLALHEHMPHAFQWMPGFLPEAKKAEEEIVAWIRERGPAWRGRGLEAAP